MGSDVRLVGPARVELSPEVRAKYEELTRGKPGVELSERDRRDFRIPRAGDQSALVYRLCLRAISAGCGAAQLIKELCEESNGGTHSVNARLRGKYGTDWLVRTVRKAYEQIATELVALDRIEACAHHHEWRPVTFTNPRGTVETARASTVQKVMMASIDLARQRTTTSPMLGKIELARLTGLSEKTVRKAMRGLEDEGWIETIKQRYRTASTYRLHEVPRPCA